MGKINFSTPLPGIVLFLMLLVGILITQTPAAGEEVQASEKNSSSTSSESGSLIDQIRLFFHIEDTTKDLDMEETGISGLSDTAGQSVGKKKLSELIQLYQEKLAQDPGNNTIKSSLATMWETLGETDKALTLYEDILQTDPENQEALRGIQRINKSRQVLARVYWSYIHQKEYAPTLNRDLATWEEQTRQVQVSKSWGQGKTLSIGWLDSTIEQKNEIYHDTDFSLKRQAPFLSFSWPLMENISMDMRIRDEKFTNDDDDGFYRLDSSEHIITGYLVLGYNGENIWSNFNYSREREPDPVYDIDNVRSALNIEVKELTGISGGFAIAPRWELGASIYYEQYGSDREDQFNPNIQLSHWLQLIPGSKVSLGYGYYTEEDESITNLTTSYQWRPWEKLIVRLEYQLEYSANEESWLNQGDVLVNLNLGNRLSLVTRMDYSKELSGDEDENFFVQTSLNWSF